MYNELFEKLIEGGVDAGNVTAPWDNVTYYAITNKGYFFYFTQDDYTLTWMGQSSKNDK
jgi:hypothetical protein